MTLRLVAEAREAGTTIRLVGRMRSEDIDQVREEIAASDAPTALDLDELGLADAAVIRFLLAAEREGIGLRHCPPFVREWMAREAASWAPDDLRREVLTVSDSLEDLRSALMGEWVSVAPELRPSAAKNADGAIKPLYLQRTFSYHTGDRFQLAIATSVDPYGQIPLARILLEGHMVWLGPHPIAAGAQRVDFIADEAYEVTPLAQAFVDVLNRIAHDGFSTWQVDGGQSVLGKTFTPFGLVAGRHFQECDLVYLREDLLFWGARHVDGRGFDAEENRPTNLQIPLVRRSAKSSEGWVA